MKIKPLLIILSILFSVIALVGINPVSANVAQTYYEPCDTGGFDYTWTIGARFYTYSFPSDHLYVYGVSSNNNCWEYFYLATSQLQYWNTTYPITFTFSINATVFNQKSCYGWLGFTNSSAKANTYLSNANCTNIGAFFEVNSAGGAINFIVNNGSWQSLSNTAYTQGTNRNLTIVMTETTYNTFDIVAYVDTTAVYTGTQTIAFNNVVTMQMCFTSTEAYSYNDFAYIHGVKMIESVTYLTIDNQITRIFSGFVGTVIDQLWTTFETLATYISSITTYIYSGIMQVISTYTIYFQSIFGQIAQTVVNIVTGTINYISKVTTYLMLGFRNGIAWVTIHITQPLSNGISYVIVTIRTGIFNGISTITIYLQSLYSGVEPTPVLFIAMNYLIFLLVLLIPTYALYNYVGSIAVIPTLDLMSIVCYISGLCNFGIMLIILIVSIGVLFRSRIRERFN